MFATRATARRATRATLSMHVCLRCGFVFNEEFDAAKLAYGADYDNTQECSAAFARHLEQLARRVVEHHGLRNAHIVEVGCGKGSFLRRLTTYPETDNRGIGYDPSYTGPDSELGGRLRFYRENYGPASAHGGVDVVICRHVIEHVADPVALLEAIGGSVRRSPSPLVFFETPCVEWILEHRVVWDFFYEHCSLFAAGTLAAALRAAGFRVDTVHRVFGGQYLWLEAGVAERTPEPGWAAGDVPALTTAFAAAEVRQRQRWGEAAAALARTGRVALWGAGAKGVTFANLVDPDGDIIDCIVDLNPAKQGKFLPGTGHPIVSQTDMAARGVRHAILMNPIYGEENAALLRSGGIEANLIELA
ncbi:MAG: class I SAM-dependent methyltransferase [Candidatus Rokuibacteriota bacterium]